MKRAEQLKCVYKDTFTVGAAQVFVSAEWTLNKDLFIPYLAAVEQVLQCMQRDRGEIQGVYDSEPKIPQTSMATRSQVQRT